MTPPDAMSWEEAIEVMRELIRRFTGTVPTPMNRYGESSMAIEHFISLTFDANRALAAIQSHRVQAEALAEAAYRMAQAVTPKERISAREELYPAIDAYRNTDAALAAAANNDGAQG